MTGFLAQDVAKAAHELNYEFSGVDIPDNDKDLYTLRYSEFVVPLVKAVQEQQDEIRALKSENNQLKHQLAAFEKRLQKLEKK
jgi:predicted RNase H-like nuclease (RuvC/YqgF family)